jgi:hypothetical protein
MLLAVVSLLGILPVRRDIVPISAFGTMILRLVLSGFLRLFCMATFAFLVSARVVVAAVVVVVIVIITHRRVILGPAAVLGHGAQEVPSMIDNAE